MLLPKMLSQLVLALVPRSIALWASLDVAEMADEVDAMDGSFVAGTISVALEGQEAPELTAGDSEMSCCRGGGGDLSLLVQVPKRKLGLECRCLRGGGSWVHHPLTKVVNEVLRVCVIICIEQRSLSGIKCYNMIRQYRMVHPIP